MYEVLFGGFQTRVPLFSCQPRNKKKSAPQLHINTNKIHRKAQRQKHATPYSFCGAPHPAIGGIGKALDHSIAWGCSQIQPPSRSSPQPTRAPREPLRWDDRMKQKKIGSAPDIDDSRAACAIQLKTETDKRQKTKQHVSAAGTVISLADPVVLSRQFYFPPGSCTDSTVFSRASCSSSPCLTSILASFSRPSANHRVCRWAGGTLFRSVLSRTGAHDRLGGVGPKPVLQGTILYVRSSARILRRPRLISDSNGWVNPASSWQA
jgi:hypothetical protein